jgi:polyhydroxyalkanoate synthesis regulator phasin
MILNYLMIARSISINISHPPTLPISLPLSPPASRYNSLQEVQLNVAPMTKPVLDSFFLGRALAESLNDKLGETLTYTLSELGKINAEQGEKLRQFTQEVIDRAARETAQAGGNTTTVSATGQTVDVQETIDDLRAEIARLRAEIQTHRQQG